MSGETREKALQMSGERAFQEKALVEAKISREECVVHSSSSWEENLADSEWKEKWVKYSWN